MNGVFLAILQIKKVITKEEAEYLPDKLSFTTIPTRYKETLKIVEGLLKDYETYK